MPLIFLHGWALSSDAFKTLISLLAQHYYVLAPDMPGFGKSEHPGLFWGYEAYAQYLVEFMNTLGVKNALLAGQSMGGGICVATAALYPEYVKALVLANSAGVPLKPVRKLAIPRVQEIALQALRSKFRRENLHLSKAFARNFSFRLTHVFSILPVPMKHDLRPLLNMVEKPCLLAWGRHDCLMPLAAATEFEKRIKGSKLVILDDGYHEWCLVQPHRFVSMVADFVQEYHLVN